MCDIYNGICEECDRSLPMHIGDFCTPRDNVVLRCIDHAPSKDDGLKWVLFVGNNDYIEQENYGDFFIAVRDETLVDKGYWVGEAGDIVPNCDWMYEIK